MPRPAPSRAATALMLGLVALAGCGDREEAQLSRKVIDFTTVPAPVLEAAKKELPGVRFTDAWTNHRPGQEAIHSYEVRGRNTQTGKTREARVGPDGTILEIE